MAYDHVVRGFLTGVAITTILSTILAIVFISPEPEAKAKSQAAESEHPPLQSTSSKRAHLPEHLRMRSAVRKTASAYADPYSKGAIAAAQRAKKTTLEAAKAWEIAAVRRKEEELQLEAAIKEAEEKRQRAEETEVLRQQTSQINELIRAKQANRQTQDAFDEHAAEPGWLSDAAAVLNELPLGVAERGAELEAANGVAGMSEVAELCNQHGETPSNIGEDECFEEPAWLTQAAASLPRV